MFDNELPDFPFPVKSSDLGCMVYLHDNVVHVYNKYQSYYHISEDELHGATNGSWGIIPEGLRLESKVSVEFLYIIGRGI